MPLPVDAMIEQLDSYSEARMMVNFFGISNGHENQSYELPLEGSQGLAISLEIQDGLFQFRIFKDGAVYFHAENEILPEGEKVSTYYYDKKDESLVKNAILFGGTLVGY